MELTRVKKSYMSYMECLNFRFFLSVGFNVVFWYVLNIFWKLDFRRCRSQKMAQVTQLVLAAEKFLSGLRGLANMKSCETNKLSACENDSEANSVLSEAGLWFQACR